MSRLLAATLIFLLAGCAADEPVNDRAADRPHKEVVVPAGARPPSLFSPAVRTGDLVFVSGTLGTAPGSGLVEGGVEAETRQALENIRARLEVAGAGLEDAVKCTVFLADMEDYGAMNDVYREFFPSDPPARSTVAVSALALDARVEIDCVAALPR